MKSLGHSSKVGFTQRFPVSNTRTIGSPFFGAGTMNVQLVCTPPITRYRDEDNLIATCKAYLDGCAASLCVDDTTFHFREQVWNKAEAPGHLLLQFDWEEPDE
ncbi:hypothetical protein [Duodenibacillus massiliensis]|uniref:hypothetical protein n=1 Tax=Duodenibacillus massiliensis TaxID=1852381 RepID=UPI003AF42FFB